MSVRQAATTEKSSARPDEDNMRTTEPRMPFGKYRGKSVSEVLRQDPSYLTWFCDNVAGNGVHQGGDPRVARLLRGVREVLPATKAFRVSSGLRPPKSGRCPESLPRGSRQALLGDPPPGDSRMNDRLVPTEVQADQVATGIAAVQPSAREDRGRAAHVR